MRIDISGASAVIRNQEILTVGMVGAKVEFRFSEEWNGLGKIAVFRQAGVSKDVTLTSAVATIPWEVLHAPGLPVSIGVYGANSDGTVVIPTIWVETRPLRPGADPSGDESADPTQPVWGQLQAQMTELYAAVNEHAANSAAPIVVKSSGEIITVDDSADRAFQGFKIYGKTTQDGTPTPDVPVEIVSAGHDGSLTVSVTGEDESQSMTIATPNGLPGIPVSSGGNYTDANGQQWVCDEIDFDRGVYVRRVLRASDLLWKVADNNGYPVGNSLMFRSSLAEILANTQIRHRAAVCSKLPYNNSALNNEVNGFYFSYGTIYARIAGVADLDTFVGLIDGAEILTFLDKATETPLSAEALAAFYPLRTYRGNTVVSNDAGAYMDLEYVMDAKKYIDSLITGGVVPATVE